MSKQKKFNKHLLGMIANLAQRLHKVEQAINRYDTWFDVLQARVTKLEPKDERIIQHADCPDKK